jgi:hypothetical protein
MLDYALEYDQVWIKGYEGKYIVSKQGQVFRLTKKGELVESKGWISNGKYLIKLSKNGKTKEISKAVTVWQAFMGEIPKGHLVVRKNGVREDVYLQNLKLLTCQENGKLTGGTARSKEVVLIDELGDEVNSWKSARRAAKELYCSYQTISDICNKKRKDPVYPLKWATTTRRNVRRG